jgi:hypothetical protein
MLLKMFPPRNCKAVTSLGQNVAGYRAPKYAAVVFYADLHPQSNKTCFIYSKQSTWILISLAVGHFSMSQEPPLTTATSPLARQLWRALSPREAGTPDHVLQAATPHVFFFFCVHFCASVSAIFWASECVFFPCFCEQHQGDVGALQVR